MTGREELMKKAGNAMDTEYKKKGKGKGQGLMKVRVELRVGVSIKGWGDLLNFEWV